MVWLPLFWIWTHMRCASSSPSEWPLWSKSCSSASFQCREDRSCSLSLENLKSICFRLAPNYLFPSISAQTTSIRIQCCLPHSTWSSIFLEMVFNWPPPFFHFVASPSFSMFFARLSSPIIHYTQNLQCCLYWLPPYPPFWVF